MYVESFVLTVDPAEVRSGSVILGEALDGGFRISAIPSEVRFGALLELALDPEDGPGAYEVEILLEYARLDGAPQVPIDEPFTIHAVETSPDWWGPRLVHQPLAISLRFWHEFEGYLVVRINGEEEGEKALRAIHVELPDAVGEL